MTERRGRRLSCHVPRRNAARRYPINITRSVLEERKETILPHPKARRSKASRLVSWYIVEGGGGRRRTLCPLFEPRTQENSSRTERTLTPCVRPSASGTPATSTEISLQKYSSSPRSERRRPAGETRLLQNEGRVSLMILPQVHLRKPCYDFYFL